MRKFAQVSRKNFVFLRKIVEGILKETRGIFSTSAVAQSHASSRKMLRKIPGRLSPKPRQLPTRPASQATTPLLLPASQPTTSLLLACFWCRLQLLCYVALCYVAIRASSRKFRAIILLFCAEWRFHCKGNIGQHSCLPRVSFVFLSKRLKTKIEIP